MNGKIRFDFLNTPNQLMQELFTGNSQNAKSFQSNPRKFNTSLSFASAMFKTRELTSHGPPIVSIEGNIQHKIGSLFKDPNKVASFMQCYFYEEGEINKPNAFFDFSNQEVIKPIMYIIINIQFFI